MKQQPARLCSAPVDSGFSRFGEIRNLRWLLVVSRKRRKPRVLMLRTTVLHLLRGQTQAPHASAYRALLDGQQLRLVPEVTAMGCPKRCARSELNSVCFTLIKPGPLQIELRRVARRAPLPLSLSLLTFFLAELKAAARHAFSTGQTCQRPLRKAARAPLPATFLSWSQDAKINFLSIF